jgi:hypothetical protein
MFQIFKCPWCGERVFWLSHYIFLYRHYIGFRFNCSYCDNSIQLGLSNNREDKLIRVTPKKALERRY